MTRRALRSVFGATTGHAVAGGGGVLGGPSVMDVVACLYPALVGAATSGGAMVVATMDIVNNTPSPQTDSADCSLKSFSERITKARHPPLLELPGHDSATDRRPPPVLPKKSRRIAAQSLSHIPTTKREKERELGHAYSEIKGLKVTEALKDKAIAELSKELKKQDEKMRGLEKQLEQKNLEVKRLNNERKEALSAQFAAEATLRRIHSSQKDEESVPFDAIIAPLESDIRKYRHKIAVLQDDKKALERHLKLKEVALVEASNILRSALERALIVEDVQNQNIELKKQMEIYHEENKLLEKANRQKVLEVKKLTHTISELEESILATGEVANAVHFYQNQATKLNEEKRTLERELARAKVYVNRVASTAANEWKDDSDKLMPVKTWLEERRLLQGEIQRLRDNITIAEKSSKIEAQLNDKLKRRIKSLEDDMRNETSNPSTKEINKQATPRRSTSQPKQCKTARVLPQPYSHEAIDRRRPISQPRTSVAGKVLKQPNLETKPIEKTSVVKRFDSPRARTVYSKGECPIKNQPWASKGKLDVVAGKENKVQNPNSKTRLNVSHLQGHADTKVFDGNDEYGIQSNEHHEAMENERNGDSSSDESSS